MIDVHPCRESVFSNGAGGGTAASTQCADVRAAFGSPRVEVNRSYPPGADRDFLIPIKLQRPFSEVLGDLVRERLNRSSPKREPKICDADRTLAQTHDRGCQVRFALD